MSGRLQAERNTDRKCPPDIAAMRASECPPDIAAMRASECSPVMRAGECHPDMAAMRASECPPDMAAMRASECPPDIAAMRASECSPVMRAGECPPDIARTVSGSVSEPRSTFSRQPATQRYNPALVPNSSSDRNGLTDICICIMHTRAPPTRASQREGWGLETRLTLCMSNEHAEYL